MEQEKGYLSGAAECAKNNPGAEEALQIPVRQPHDKGYKRDLRNPKEFLHFLKKYVGAEWTKGLSESQLRLCDKELIGKDYEGKEADPIYEITLDPEKIPTKNIRSDKKGRQEAGEDFCFHPAGAAVQRGLHHDFPDCHVYYGHPVPLLSDNPKE